MLEVANWRVSPRKPIYVNERIRQFIDKWVFHNAFFVSRIASSKQLPEWTSHCKLLMFSNVTNFCTLAEHISLLNIWGQLNCVLQVLKVEHYLQNVLYRCSAEHIIVLMRDCEHDCRYVQNTFWTRRVFFKIYRVDITNSSFVYSFIQKEHFEVILDRIWHTLFLFFYYF